ncbi:hypothetical protein G6F49_012885 [Rhizopus delemar]|nr:hypothetical protein G6F49_012885 [Rhizopus delemar]
MRECIDTWLKDEVIERASPNSDWNSPLTLAPKKDLLGNLTGHRPCLDPRLLKRFSINYKDQLSLPLLIFDKHFIDSKSTNPIVLRPHSLLKVNNTNLEVVHLD